VVIDCLICGFKDWRRWRRRRRRRRRMAQQLVATMNRSAEGTIVCYAPTMITTNGVWQGDNPLDFSLPLFILQLTLVVVTTRILVFLLKPLRQPRVVSEILGGVILGPSVLGRSSKFARAIFPLRSVMVLETMANVGLLYFLFLVGVEMDITVVRRTGRRAMLVAVAGMVLPFLIGTAFSFFLDRKGQSMTQGTFILFLGVALSVTAFPVLARILAELKLINTELGRIALSSALINDMCAWVLLALAIALSENQSTSLASLWVILSSVAFVTFCIFVVRPLGVVASSVRASEQGSIWVPGSHCCASLECWEHHLPLLTPASTTSSLLWYGHEAIFFVRYVPFYNAIIFIWSTKSSTTYNIYICLYMYSK